MFDSLPSASGWQSTFCIVTLSRYSLRVDVYAPSVAEPIQYLAHHPGGIDMYELSFSFRRDRVRFFVRRDERPGRAKGF